MIEESCKKVIIILIRFHESVKRVADWTFRATGDIRSHVKFWSTNYKYTWINLLCLEILFYWNKHYIIIIITIIMIEGNCKKVIIILIRFHESVKRVADWTFRPTENIRSHVKFWSTNYRYTWIIIINIVLGNFILLE